MYTLLTIYDFDKLAVKDKLKSYVIIRDNFNLILARIAKWR